MRFGVPLINRRATRATVMITSGSRNSSEPVPGWKRPWGMVVWLSHRLDSNTSEPEEQEHDPVLAAGALPPQEDVEEHPRRHGSTGEEDQLGDHGPTLCRRGARATSQVWRAATASWPARPRALARSGSLSRPLTASIIDAGVVRHHNALPDQVLEPVDSDRGGHDGTTRIQSLKDLQAGTPSGPQRSYRHSRLGKVRADV